MSKDFQFQNIFAKILIGLMQLVPLQAVMLVEIKLPTSISLLDSLKVVFKLKVIAMGPKLKVIVIITVSILRFSLCFLNKNILGSYHIALKNINKKKI